MTTSTNPYPKSVSPTKGAQSKTIARNGEEIPGCSGMTANCSSRSLIYRPARKDAMIEDENGGSLVEFAIIAPLLFVILFGIIEFGVLLYDKAMLTNASREGARAGIVYDFDSTAGTNHPDNDTIIATVQQYCQNYLISFDANSAVGVTISRAGSSSLDSAGDQLTVNVTYPFRFLVFSNVLALVDGSINDSLNLQAETVMRME